MSAPRRLRMGMVGGGMDAFIGAVHRKAAALDGQIDFTAGALSSTPARATASAQALGLAADRSYPDWRAMLAGELKRDDRIDFVSVVTPNDLHFPVARAFLDAGIHVICDKPLTHTPEQARELAQLAKARNVVLAVTYNYSGYPLVIEARERVARGVLGEIRKVVVEYHQGWLAQAQGEDNKQATWRTDPGRSGLGGALGDIGTHAEHLLTFVSGLKIEEVCAEVSTFVPGRRLDDDTAVLLRLSGGARGLIQVSQIEIGGENDLRLSVYGTLGSLHWQQEQPNSLTHSRLDGPAQTLTRGSAYLSEQAKQATRLPGGHPEAFIEAFANIYLAAAAEIRARQRGESGPPERSYPDAEDGLRGVQFIHTVLENSRGEAKWTATPAGEPR